MVSVSAKPQAVQETQATICLFFPQYRHRNPAPQGIADAELERPLLRPRFGLLILQDLDENVVLALLESAAGNVLIHAIAMVVLFPEKNFLAVEENAHGIVAAGT